MTRTWRMTHMGCVRWFCPDKWRKRKVVPELAPLTPDQLEYVRAMLGSILTENDPRKQIVIGDK